VALTDAQIKGLLASAGEAQAALFLRADAVRRESVGSNVYFRGIIEFSNACEKDCHYCGIRRSNCKVNRYRMSFEEIAEGLAFVNRSGFASVVLQSGELTSRPAIEFLLKVVRHARQEYPDMGITLSCGELSYEVLKRLREAGADRYLLRIESSVPALYRTLHPANHSWTNRVAVLKNLKRLGYQVGCGNMVGLPGQTLDDLVSDLRFFQEMDFDMFGLGPYVIHEDTPLATPETVLWWNENREEIFQKTLRFISVLRLLMPTCNIAAATALDVFTKEGRVRALEVGANVLMPSITPQKYREDYLLYQDKPCVDGHAFICAGCVIKKVESAGLKAAVGERGDSLHWRSAQCPGSK
jgi:biotin synthase